MADGLDSELIGLLNRLNKVQKDVGGGKKDRKLLGDVNGKIDRFLDLSETMKERLDIIKESGDEIRKLEKVPGSNPTELITHQSKVRTELNLIAEEWKELDSLYRLETKKKRSRYTSEELSARQSIVVQMQRSIQELKDMQRSGFVKGIEGKRMVTMEESELFKKRDIETGGVGGSVGEPVRPAPSQPRGVTGSRNNHMTDDHRGQLMALKERDAQVDVQIEEIGKGLDILRELALQANEEVKLQNRMLDGLEEKVNDVHEKVSNLNERMLETLEKTRKGDKICMDIFCILIFIGMIIVLVKLSEDNKKK